MIMAVYKWLYCFTIEVGFGANGSFQILRDCTHFIEAQLIRTGFVLWSSKGGSQCTQTFPILKFFL